MMGVPGRNNSPQRRKTIYQGDPTSGGENAPRVIWTASPFALTLELLNTMKTGPASATGLNLRACACMAIRKIEKKDKLHDLI